MSIRFLARAAAVALLASGLGGCLGLGGGENVAPHMKQLPAAAQALLAAKGMTQDAPIFVRIFKEESELEIWKLKGDRFEHFKTYPICAWSGELGPKVSKGDKQAPEGFYTVTPGLMNPKSQFHLAFNLGYPNPYDRANNRSGSALMVHGDCRSAGCFAMTDALIEEIYILAREAFKGGQTKFHVHAFPFRMTEENMKRHRKNKWYPFWVSLKEGYDAFNKSRRPPIVKVCQKQYLVNVEFMGHVAEPDPSGPCPVYAKVDPEKMPGIDGVPPTLLASLKQRDEELNAKMAKQAEPVTMTASVSEPKASEPETPAKASSGQPTRVAAAPAAETAPPAPARSDAPMSASPVLRAPVRATAAMAASFSPVAPSSLRPAPVQAEAVALPSAGNADEPGDQESAQSAGAAPVVETQTPPAAPTAPAAPAVVAAEPPPSRHVDPDAVQKPNRSGKGGKLTASAGAQAGQDSQTPVAVGYMDEAATQ